MVAMTPLSPTFGPGLVDGRLLPEFLGQVVEPLQAPDLVEQPFLVALLRLLQVLPPVVDVLGTAGTGLRGDPRLAAPSPSSPRAPRSHFSRVLERNPSPNPLWERTKMEDANQLSPRPSSPRRA